jgi:glycine dehydrogenase subunit 1
LNDTFIHPYMPNTAPSNKNAMLEALGISCVEDIYGKNIPEELRYRGKMNIPEPILTEQGLKKHVMAILSKNATCEEYTSFLGGGCYNHYVPAICDEINNRAEFLTGYCGDTYSDHGKMQAIFEYASLMAELLDMDVVSYTLYDGGQAVASSLRMAVRIQEALGHPEKNVLLVPSTMNPEILSQLRNYCQRCVEIRVVPCKEDGRMDTDALKELLSAGDIAALFLENPSYLGFWEEQIYQIGEMVHEAGALYVVQPDVASLGVIAPPSQYGADIACGDIQPLGMHLQFGGGCAGFIATPYNETYIDQYPTYLYGITRTENPGEYGWGRALNYRCSHGSREKAREYFGTETGLWAITAAVYLSLMGPEGMREMAEYIIKMRHYAVSKLASVPGITVNSLGGNGFQEFVIDFSESGKNVAEVNQALLEYGIFGGKDLSHDFPKLGQSALYAVTEKTTCQDVNALADALAAILGGDK